MPEGKVNTRIKALLAKQGRVTSGDLAEALSISRQAAHRHLKHAVELGLLIAVGEGRASHYVSADATPTYPIAGSAEDRILEDVERRFPAVGALEVDDARIFRYAFTEMVNNALDHSSGTHVSVRPRITKSEVDLVVEDDGIGAFARVKDGKHLASIVEAAAELTKGKVTTAPERHTGEGVFFTSKAVDRFELTANGFALTFDRGLDDVAIRVADPRRGTKVHLVLKRPAKRSLVDIFQEYTKNYEFVRTRTVVRLFGIGVDFVSRSEARRIVSGLERFREVVLDFEGVAGVGQGFADEVFRVFANAHPEVELIAVNMNEAVELFVRRAITARHGA